VQSNLTKDAAEAAAQTLKTQNEADQKSLVEKQKTAQTEYNTKLQASNVAKNNLNIISIKLRSKNLTMKNNSNDTKNYDAIKANAKINEETMASNFRKFNEGVKAIKDNLSGPSINTITTYLTEEMNKANNLPLQLDTDPEQTKINVKLSEIYVKS